MTDMIHVRTEGLTVEEQETVAYLEHCMGAADEKGMLARVVYDMLAFGEVTPHRVASILGAYDPNGISLDDDDLVEDLEINDEDENLDATLADSTEEEN